MSMVERFSYKSCPISKNKTPGLECKTCEYRNDCLDDVWRDYQEGVLKLTKDTIKIVREIVERHEIKNTKNL